MDADRHPAPDAQVGPLVDAHDLLARPQPLVDPPLPEHRQVRLRPLPPQDRQPAQLIDLIVGTRVGQHPARGVLDGHDAIGHRRHRLGQREQVAERLAQVRVGGQPGVVHGRPREGFQPLPADLGPHAEQRDPAVDRGIAQGTRVGFGVDLDCHGGGAIARRGAHQPRGSPATRADDQHEIAVATAAGLLLRVDNDDVTHLDVEAARCREHVHQGLAHRDEELAQRHPHHANAHRVDSDLRHPGPHLFNRTI